MSLPRTMILGAWELVAFQSRDVATTEIRYPLGQRPRGLILYTDDGFMSAQLAPENTEAGTEIDGYIAYSGPFHVDEAASTVRHDVQMASMPELLAQPQLREAAIVDDTLTLSAVMTDSTGSTTRSTLTWRRPARRHQDQARPISRPKG
ncbi:lipocalin-like domain-containing protein [Mycolicibacterium mengxianglii]|uniref:lipocalin-like domain-containing protein n=1 Tax=Mycolicibacterium mengxianglii TaxID=2736649 RepID=UPI0018EF03DF|nr:lipocalin-like domain-containing protein [Mycolicibacterium mengxianglii]